MMNLKDMMAKLLSYDINKDIDLQNNLLMEHYANRTLFFDFYAMNYQIKKF